MPTIPAHIGDRKIGTLHIPEGQNFAWYLKLATSARTSVTVPVRVGTGQRGWSQYYFADLKALNPTQMHELAQCGALSLDTQQAAA